jgi:hypothetical protein
MFQNKPSIGTVSGTSLSAAQVNALKSQFSDGERFAEQLNNGLRNAARNASSTNNASSGNLLSNIATGTITTVFGGLYDRYLNDSYRFGKEKVADLLSGAATSMANLNVAGIGKSLFKFIKDNAKDAIAAQAEIDDKLIQTFKEKGMMVGEIGNSMKEELRDTIPYAVNLGVSATDFIRGTESLLAAQGKFITYSDQTLQSATLAGKAFTEDSMAIMQNVDNFRNVGLGLSDAAREITKVGKSSLNVGLNAKETTKTVMANLDKLNQYGFKNGIEGLSKMVQQAQALKVGMEATFKIAEKAFEPEGAIDLSARLQVIGGAMGDLNDPLRLMYDVTNNMEGIQTSLIDAASSLATFNTQQGRFEVTGANLRKAKAMADAFGISMSELTNMATKGAAKLEAMSELQMFPTLTDDQKEFASNLAQMKDGKIGIEVPKSMWKDMGLKDGFVELSSLSGDQINKISEMQKEIADQSPLDIAREQMNTTTKMANTLTAIMLQVGALGFNSSIAKRGRDALSGAEKGMNSYGNPGQIQGVLQKMQAQGAAELTELMNTIGIDQEDMEKFKTKASEIKNNVIDSTKELYKEGKEKIEDAWKNLFGKIDINLHIDASNADATMLANAINRSPQIKTDLSEALTTGVRSYFANQTTNMG